MAERTIVQEVENATLYSDGCIKIEDVRASFPYLAEPRVSKGDDGVEKKAFEITVLLPKTTHKAAKDLVKTAITSLMTANSVKVASEYWCLKDGDAVEAATKAAGDEYDPGMDDSPVEHRGHFTVKASEKGRPSVRNRRGNVMSQAEIESEIYGGCWVDVLIRPWYFNGKAKNGKTYPKRMPANLIAVRKRRTDTPFGQGRVDDTGVFEALGDDDNGFSDNDNGGL